INLFDGTASLVKGSLRDLIREQLPGQDKTHDTDDNLGTEDPDDTEKPGDSGDDNAPPQPPPRPQRHSRVAMRVDHLKIGQTNNLQPYLFKPLAEQDPGAELDIIITVRSSAGIPADVLNNRIVEGLDQLHITVKWEPEG
ncbi:MAG: hypothetical protein ACKOWF_11745, partial [Chloroflexota bacterium]